LTYDGHKGFTEREVARVHPRISWFLETLTIKGRLKKGASMENI
jgi:hypothetical protein